MPEHSHGRPASVCTPPAELAGLILVIPQKPDDERDQVAAAWLCRGGIVQRLDRFWDPPPLPAESVRVYGPDTFGLVVAEKLGLHLVEPDPRFLAHVPPTLLGRRVGVVPLRACAGLQYPRFVKPVVPKQFAAKVYGDLRELQQETRGLEMSTEVMESEVVGFLAEARCFLFGGRLLACSVYEGVGDADGASRTCQELANALKMSEPVVVDLGLLASGEWVVIEANAAWGAGLNGCDASSVVPCIAAATRVARL